jgi:hypothetical protein
MDKGSKGEAELGGSVLAPVLHVLKKDRAKLALIVESHSSAYNSGVLESILNRHSMLEKWNREYSADTGD